MATIETGGTYVGVGSSSVSPAGKSASHQETPLFNAQTTNTLSAIVTVQSGMMCIVSGYNLRDIKVTCHGVIVQSPIHPHGHKCSGITTGVAEVFMRSPMKIGGRVWELSDDEDRIIITLPGQYQFEIPDEALAYVGEFYVSYRMESAIDLPDSYKVGVL